MQSSWGDIIKQDILNDIAARKNELEMFTLKVTLDMMFNKYNKYPRDVVDTGLLALSTRTSVEVDNHKATIKFYVEKEVYDEQEEYMDTTMTGYLAITGTLQHKEYGPRPFLQDSALLAARLLDLQGNRLTG